MPPEYRLPDTFPYDDSDGNSEYVYPQYISDLSYQTPVVSDFPSQAPMGSSLIEPTPAATMDAPAQVSRRKPSARLIAGVIFLVVVLAGSSLFFFAKSGRSVLPANPHATAAPGVGVPVDKGDWEITLSKVHQESSLQGMDTFGTGSGTYTPDSGYTFLVLDIQLRGLHGNQGLTISPNIFALVSQDGSTSSPALVSDAAIPGYSSGVVSMTSSGNEMQLSLAFVIPQASIGQIFKLDFQGSPLLSFTGK